MKNTYKPIRDRGVYRAALNPKNENHLWGKDLVDSAQSKNPGIRLSAILKWTYRDKGYIQVLRGLLYMDNPLLMMREV